MSIDPIFGPNADLIGVPGSHERLTTPCLLIYLDRLEANIEKMATHMRAKNHALRPVAKIHKSVEIARRQVEAGALGQCCATLAEAEVMVKGGIPGVMLFSSVVTPPKIERLIACNAEAQDLLVVVDDAGNVDDLARAAKTSGKPLQLLVDFEVGGRRTGLASPDEVCDLAQRIADADGLVYAGIQGYNGKLQATRSYVERARQQAERVAPLKALCDRLETAGLGPRIVTGGGTGSHEIDPDQGVFTEAQVGTYIFIDTNYLGCEMWHDEPEPFVPSLFVRTTVIGAAQPGFVITDAGVKELNRDALHPIIVSGAPKGATYDLVGDDLGRINLPEGASPLAVGDAVEVITPHCYATLNLYSVYHCMRGDTLVDIWPIEARATW